MFLRADRTNETDGTVQANETDGTVQANETDRPGRADETNEVIDHTMLLLVLLLVGLAAAVPLCRIAQHGVDGFGHQYHGKLSCILLAAMDSRFAYLHRPFQTFEHTPIPGRFAEWYTNVSFGQPGLNESRPRERLGDTQWLELLHQHGPEKYCDPDKIYVTDNCWPAVNWMPSYAAQVRLHQLAISEPFFGSVARAKYAHVPARFPDRSVVVMHVRRGDAMWRIKGHEQEDGLNFFLRGIQWSAKFIHERGDPPPMFVIATDEPQWMGIRAMMEMYPNHTTLLTGDVFDTFEYFVHAYGLMVSMSSLSYAGWLLNGGVKFALIPRHLQASENTQWLKPEFGWFTAL